MIDFWMFSSIFFFFIFCSCIEMIRLLFSLFLIFLIYFWLCWVFVAMLAFSSCSEWGLLSSCLVQASLVSAHRLQGMQGSVVEAHGLSSCISWALDYRLSSWDAWALLLCCIWHFPGSEIEPASPALVGGIFTTEPPGKPHFSPLTHSYFNIFIDLIF